MYDGYARLRIYVCKLERRCVCRGKKGGKNSCSAARYMCRIRKATNEVIDQEVHQTRALNLFLIYRCTGELLISKSINCNLAVAAVSDLF